MNRSAGRQPDEEDRMNKTERTDRIAYMERILDEHARRIRQLEEALTAFQSGQEMYEELKNYYGSEEYFSDAEASNNGELPESLKCGVLSEDAVFELIGDNFKAAVSMLETATNVIKRH